MMVKLTKNLAILFILTLAAIVGIIFTPYNSFAKLHLIALVFGLFLFTLIIRNLDSKSRIFFAMAILFSLLWTAAHFKAMTLPGDAEWGAKMLFAVDMICITFTSCFAGLFSYYFDKEKMKLVVAIICILPFLAVPHIVFFDIVGAEYSLEYGWDTVQYMPFFIPYLMLVSIPALYGTLNLFRIRKELKGRSKDNMDLLIMGLFFALFIPVLIDGVLHPFFGLPSFGSVGITIGFLVMSVPYLREQVR
jgi:hypothetical protein